MPEGRCAIYDLENKSRTLVSPCITGLRDLNLPVFCVLTLKLLFRRHRMFPKELQGSGALEQFFKRFRVLVIVFSCFLRGSWSLEGQLSDPSRTSGLSGQAGFHDGASFEKRFKFGRRVVSGPWQQETTSIFELRYKYLMDYVVTTVTADLSDYIGDAISLRCRKRIGSPLNSQRKAWTAP